MNHTRTIRLPGVTVWSECASSSSARDRYYAQVPQPTTLPTVAFSPSDADPKSGISAIAFSNPEGTLVATKCDSMPSTVWIWSLKLLRPYAVLVHLNPVKSIDWHPTIPELLMVQCAPEDKSSSAEAGAGMMVYLWSTTWKQPRAIHMPLAPAAPTTTPTTPTTTWAKWVRTPPPSRSTSSSVASTSPQPYTGRITRSHSPQEELDKRPMILYGDREICAVGHIEDEPIPDVEEDMGDDADVIDTNRDTATTATTSFSSPENRNWSCLDWEYYLPNGLPKRTLSSASRSSNLSLPAVRLHHDGHKPHGGGLEKVSSESNKECEDTFGVHKPGVSVVT